MPSLSSSRRAGPRPLLRSAVVALGAGGGLAIGGALLLDAPAAYAQPAHGTLHIGHSTHSHATHGHAAHTLLSGHAGGKAPAPPWAAPARGAVNTGATATASGDHLAYFMGVPVPATVSSSGSNGNGSHGSNKADSRANKNPPGQSPTPGNSHGRSPGGPAVAGGLVPAGPSPAILTVVVRTPDGVAGRPAGYFTLPVSPFVVPGFAGLPAAGPRRPRAPLAIPAPLRQFSSQMLRIPDSLIAQGWAGDSLKAANKLKLPISLLIAMAVFVLTQALVDRRDPRVADAPERPGDDSVGFE